VTSDGSAAPVAKPPATAHAARIRPLREAVAAGLVTLLVSALGLGVTYYFSRQAQLEAVRNELAQLARVAASLVDGDLHGTLRSVDQQGSPDYRRALTPLVRFHKATEDVIYVYTHVLHEGRVVYVLDSAFEYQLPDDDQTFDPIMTPYGGNDPDVRRALETRQLVVNASLTHESVRSYLSAYAPFFDSGGGFGGVVGVDMWVRHLDERLARLWWIVVAASLGLVLISLLTGVVVFRLRTTVAAAVDRDRQAVLDLAAARDAAEQSSRAKSAFLAMMSHELRTPLNAIVGYSELMQEEFEQRGEKAVAADVKRVVSASRHLTSIISDILDYSKLEAGRLELQRTPVDVGALAAELVELMRPGASAKGVDLRLDLHPMLRPVLSDAVRLRQVLLNLFGNAVKFTELGAVTVRLRPAPGASGRLLCVVHDTGAGIPADKRSRLFKPFSQVDSSSTRAAGGTGLGLAISLRLVEMMQGSLRLKSRVGHGSTFRLSVPVQIA
jgi:two-component system, sensor histidine kinase